jgi:hypothetical protein
VDDCLLFAKATSSQARIIKDVVQSFCLASGMRINIQKSKFLTSKNHSRTKVAHLESILEFRQTTNIEKYLGFPLLSGRVKNSNFSFILDRINTRLAGWKGKLLSRADRVTLARSISSSMLIYTMQNLWVPKGVWDKIDSCINQFI